MEKKELDDFAKREMLGEVYYDDPRWEKVKELRKDEQHLKANDLVCAIRADWGL